MRMRRFTWTIVEEADVIKVLRWPANGNAPLVMLSNVSMVNAREYIARKQAKTGNDELPPAGAVVGECDWCRFDVYEGQEYEDGNGGVGIMHAACYPEVQDNTEPPDGDAYPDDVNDGRSMPKRDENNP